MVRFVLKLDPRSHIGLDDFKSLWWLPVSKRVDQIILNHIFKIKSGTSPDYMGEHFMPACAVHNYTTRFRENGSYILSKVKRFGRKSFALTGCTLCNGLPPSVKTVKGIMTFKTAFQSHLLTQFNIIYFLLLIGNLRLVSKVNCINSNVFKVDITFTVYYRFFNKRSIKFQFTTKQKKKES